MSLRVDATAVRGAFAVEATFEAEAGQTVALLGPNGAGKSTLVAAICGLAEVRRGQIELDDMVLDDAGTDTWIEPEQRPIGVVFQDLLLFPHLSALDNVAFPLRARGIAKTDARDRAGAMLERLGVRDRAQARPRDLSGGEAQRVALGRGLVHEPRLLLLDEPLSALDVGARARIRDLMRTELARFPGIRILVTHDPVEAAALADRMVLLEEGRVTQIGSPEQVRLAPHTRYAAELVGTNFFRGRLEPIGDGAAHLVTAEGNLVVPMPADPRDTDVAAILRPAAVTLSLEAPAGSARNAMLGRVLSVAVEGDRARVRLATEPPLVAEVTLGSMDRLGLREGVEVWASFKAVEIELVPS